MFESEGPGANPSHSGGGRAPLTPALPHHSLTPPPSPLKSDPTLVASRSGPTGILFSLRWLKAPSNAAPDLLLYLAEGPQSRSRAYSAEIPGKEKEAFVERWKSAFTSEPPELFEQRLTGEANAKLIQNSLDSEIPQVPPPRSVSWSTFFTPLQEPVESLSSVSGSVIRVYKDSSRGDFVVILSSSESSKSDCLAFRLKDSQHWRSHEPIRPIMRRLAASSEYENHRAINELLEYTAHGEVFFFPGSEPRSLLVAAALKRLGNATQSTLEIREVQRPDLMGISAVLAKQSVMKVSQKNVHPEAHLAVTDLLLTFSDEGLGTLALSIGWRENGKLAPGAPMMAIGRPIPSSDGTSQSHHSISSLEYDFNISDLTTGERIDWIANLIADFARNGAELHGPLTERIAYSLSEETTRGSPRMYESRRHPDLRAFHPDAEVSINEQLKRISLYFREQNTQILARTSKGAVIEAHNRWGDRLQFTIRPDGIEEAFLLPRTTVKPQKAAVGYYLGGAYQLNSAQHKIFQTLIEYFFSENGTIHRIRDREGRTVGSVGAWATHHYLSNYAPREVPNLTSPCFVVIEPPPAEQRCDQTRSAVETAISERLRGA